MRWLVLFLISCLMFATYWFQDFLSGIKPLMESQLGITSNQFGTLIGMTTIANMFGMIILGGIVLDKWGIRLTAIIFGGLAALGSALTALGAAGIFSHDPSHQMTTMIIGRIIFGVGLETTCVLINKTVVKWFKGYELALAMALNVGFGRLGTALGAAISPDIANNNASTAISFSAFLVVLGVLFYFIYLIFDVRLDKQLKENSNDADDEKFRFSDLTKLISNRSFLAITLLCVAFYSAVFPFNQYAVDLLINKFGFSYTLPQSAQIVIFGSHTLGNVFIYMAFFTFGLLFSTLPNYLKKKSSRLIFRLSMIALFIVFLYSLQDVLTIWLHNGPKAAGLIPLGTILFTPIFGRMIDKKGKAASMMIVGALLLIFAHLSLSIFNIEILAYLGMLSLGIAFSLVPAAMWPSVAKIVPEYRLGTAYAFMFTIQNWGLGILYKGIGWLLEKVNPTVVARMLEVRQELAAQGLNNEAIGVQIEEMRYSGQIPNYDYTLPILLLMGLGVISIFLAVYLKKVSKKEGYDLELP
jgi:MFS family permease